MSVTNSRWNPTTTTATPTVPSTHQPTPSQSHHPHIQSNLSSPQLKPKHPSHPASRNQNKATLTRSSILIGAGDRLPSRKFSNQTRPTHCPSPHLNGILNSFSNSLDLGSSHIDPMSLVASPSRGLDTSLADRTLSAQDLTKHDFQVKFFDWLARKILDHEQRYTDRPVLCLRPQLTRSPVEMESQEQETLARQKESVGSLVREIRKLREGIVASGRKDWFAILVYELSAELALESSDFSQLNSLLPHLVLDLYPRVPIPEHLQAPHPSGTLPGVSEALALRHRTSVEAIKARRLMFASTMLLLPFATRLVHDDFFAQFTAVCMVFQAPHKSDGGLFTGTKEQRLLDVATISKAVRRQNWVHLNRTVVPLITQALVDPKSSDDGVRWDAIVLVKLLDRFRSQVVWERIKRSYYSINDDAFLDRTLALSVLSSATLRDHKRAVDEWLSKVGGRRNESGAVVFK